MKPPRPRYYATPFTQAALAVAFAIVALAANTFETWFSSMAVKPDRSAPITLRLPARYFRITMLRNEFHYLSTSSSACPQMIPRGTVLKKGRECTGLALAFQRQRAKMSAANIAGLFIFYLVVGLFLTTSMSYGSKGRPRLLRAQVTLFGLITVIVVLSKIILLMTPLPAIILPACSVPLITRRFFRKRIAYMAAFVCSLTLASLINFDIEHFLLFLVPSLALVSLKERPNHTSTVLRQGAMASWFTLLAVLATTLVFSGTLNIYDDLTEHIDPRYSLWISAIFSGLGGGLITWALTPAIGKYVGEVSRSKLLDLQDLNQRLLGLLRDKAPGTWEHSRAMANLAEAATNAIGGNALLARIGAYYHDVGKTMGSEYFIENQGGGENPHDEISPYDSALKIHRHVIEGSKILRNEGIPEDIVEFCYSHHGTGVVEFFWHKNLEQDNPEELKEKDFCYPGHIPTTKETGIVMVVDAIEAAARTIDSPDKAVFQNLVQRIIFSKLSHCQLDETGLTLADLRIVLNTLVDTLVNMYHARIKYPWQTEDTDAPVQTTLDLVKRLDSEDEDKDRNIEGEETDAKKDPADQN